MEALLALLNLIQGYSTDLGSSPNPELFRALGSAKMQYQELRGATPPPHELGDSVGRLVHAIHAVAKEMSLDQVYQLSTSVVTAEGPGVPTEEYFRTFAAAVRQIKETPANDPWVRPRFSQEDEATGNAMASMSFGFSALRFEVKPIPLKG